MSEFGTASWVHLSQCHWDLQRLMQRVVQVRDISVVCGRRNKEDQNRMFDEGKSKLRWPNGNHNTVNPKELVRAVDIVPWPEQYTDPDVMVFVGGIVMGIAAEKDILIIWGGHWKDPWDPWHFELAE